MASRRTQRAATTVDSPFPPGPPLACPICEAGLERQRDAFVCVNGHAFDLAREGYVNLLPSQHKRRGVDGDTRAMLQARRRLLAEGHYAPLLEALVARIGAVLSLLDVDTVPTVAEAGCGEGYYVGSIETRLGSVGRAVWLGTDISKPAVRMAAKRYRDVLFFVSDVHQRIYLRDASVDVLLDVFAPRNVHEFSRVVTHGGAAFIVIPSESHLAELRAEFGLLDIEREKERKILDRFATYFRLRDRSELRFSLELEPSAVTDLIEMGPNSWHGLHRPAVHAMTTQASLILLHLERC